MLNKEDILFKYVSGNLDPEEVKSVEQQLHNSKEFQHTLEDYQSVWQKTGHLKYNDQHLEDAWSDFQQRVKAPKSTLGFDWRKMAASVALLAAVSFSLYYAWTNRSIETVAQETAIEHQLSDLTVVDLNRNSSITYHPNFGAETREVWLDGEAFFDVQPSNIPFIVHTNHGDVVVKGTEFTLFTDKNVTRIALHSGKVEYTQNNTTEILQPGESILQQSNEIHRLHSAELPQWEESIHCKNMPLSYILGQLKLYYNVEYQLPNRLLKERYTVDLPIEDLTACLTTLSTISDKNFTIQNGVIGIE